MYKGLWEDSEGGGGNNVNTLLNFKFSKKWNIFEFQTRPVSKTTHNKVSAIRSDLFNSVYCKQL